VPKQCGINVVQNLHWVRGVRSSATVQYRCSSYWPSHNSRTLSRFNAAAVTDLQTTSQINV